MIIDHLGTMKYLHKFLPNVYCIFISVIIYYTCIHTKPFLCMCVYINSGYVFSLAQIYYRRWTLLVYMHIYTGKKNPVRLK